MPKDNLKVKVYDLEGKESGEINLDLAVFGVEINQDLVHQAVVTQQANSRINFAHTKIRSEVSGGGKKPWRQKGTGRARHGSSRSPIWIGGGVTFGPRNERNFAKKINKKMKNRALLMCLTDKVTENELRVVEKFELTDAKTKKLKDILNKQVKDGKSYLVVLSKQDLKIVQASKNLPKTKIILADSLNVVDILKYDNIIVDKEGINKIVETYKK